MKQFAKTVVSALVLLVSLWWLAPSFVPEVAAREIQCDPPVYTALAC